MVWYNNKKKVITCLKINIAIFLTIILILLIIAILVVASVVIVKTIKANQEEKEKRKKFLQSYRTKVKMMTIMMITKIIPKTILQLKIL